jgi:predicted nucleic acid-binding protein
LTTTVALTAADLSLEHRLAMADSLIYATAVLHQVEVVTSDPDFLGLPRVIYLEKPRRPESPSPDS